MSGLGDTAAGLLTIAALLAVLALAYVPLGDYLTSVLTPTRHLRVERGLYRVLGVNPDGQQNARSYALAVLAFSLVSIVVLVAILMGQAYLPFSRGLAGMGPTMAINTAVSFVTNTNWQSYAGESTLGYTAQAAGLTVQNFASAAVGIAVAGALLRGFAARRSGELGNFWVDLIRIVIRVLLPLSLLVAVLLLACGVIQNLSPDRLISTVAGGSQTLPGGPVASQEAIKELGTNGGGFFNANSAHPFENPNPVSNLIEIASLLLIPVALTRTAGTMLGSRRQGTALLATMAVLWGAALAVTTWAEVAARGAVPAAAGAAMEGKETQFGQWASALFATSTTGTSTGAVNSHARLDDRGRRWRRAAQHAARRGVTRRRRLRPLRDPRRRRRRRLRGRSDGGADPGAAGQEDRCPGDVPGRRLRAGLTGPGADRARRGDGPAGHP